MKVCIKTFLAKGLKLLQQNDKDIDVLLAARFDEIVCSLLRYVNEIEVFNSAYGLVGVKDTQELISKHIFDSLAPLGIIYRLVTKICPANIVPQIADAGSGAGLPGFPLAIALPQFQFTLIERMGRRAGFLWNTKAALALENITIEENELENIKKRVFHLVTCRAFKPLEPKLLESLFDVCIEGGIIAAYKGRLEKIKQEIAPLEKFCTHWEAIPCKVPFLEEERHLLIIR